MGLGRHGEIQGAWYLGDDQGKAAAVCGMWYEGLGAGRRIQEQIAGWIAE